MLICVDDFGLAPQNSQAILELVDSRRVGAVSCMMLFSEAIEDCHLLAKRKNVQLGLHWVMTEHRPLTSMKPESGFVDCDGRMQSYSGIWIRAALRRLDLETAVRELESQWNRFREWMGRDPDFIDGHQHIHHLPVLREALLRVIQSSGRRPWVRAPKFSAVFREKKFSRSFRARNFAFDYFGRNLRTLLQKNEIPSPESLLGFYDFSREEDFRSMLDMTSHPALRSERHVFFCHAGRVDETLRTRDRLLQEREDEYRSLCMAIPPGT